MRRVHLKRCVSLLLAVVLCLSCVQLPVLAAGDGETSDAPHGYLENLSIVRGSNNSEPVYEYDPTSGELRQFDFDAERTEYNIVLPETSVGPAAMLYVPNTTATINGETSSSGLYGAWSTTDSPTHTTDLNTGGGVPYAGGSLTINGSAIRTRFNSLELDSEPVTLYYLTGNYTQSATDITYTNLDVYTFHFYRMAALSAYPTVTDGNGTVIPSDAPTGIVNPYVNSFSVTVPEDTEQLKVTAKAVTPTSTEVQFDNGKGASIVGEGDVYTLTLADYGDEYKQEDGSLQIPFTLEHTGEGSGFDGHYTLTVKFIDSGEASDAPNEYLKDISIIRGIQDTSAVYEYDAELGELKPFEFTASQTEYNIALPEAAAGASSKLYVQPQITATLNDSFSAAGLYGAWSTTSNPNSTTDLKGGTSYVDGSLTIKGTYISSLISPLNLDGSDPITLYYLTGKYTQNATEITYENLDVYTFHFYRMAALSAYPTITDEDGASIPSDAPRGMFNPNINAFSVTVPEGTARLKVTAKAKTPASTSVQFDDGKGASIVGEGDVYTLTLADYSDDYKQSDGSLQIPFTLKYTGDGSGIDGHYTLTVKFEEPEPAVPTITAEPTATVSVGELANWKPAYSATDADGGDATAQVKLSYYQNDGTTILADMDDVVEYIGDASVNKSFAVELSMDGAESVRITVTVKPAEQPPIGDEDLIANIRYLIKVVEEEKSYFDMSEAEGDGYSFVAPYGYTYNSMPLTLTEAALNYADDLRVEANLYDEENKLVASNITNGADKTYEGGRIYSKDDYVCDLSGLPNYITGNFLSFFRGVEPGAYTLKVEVVSLSNPEISDERTIQITLAPYVGYFQVDAGVRQLITQPDISGLYDYGEDHESIKDITTNIRKYAVIVPSNAETLTISGFTTPSNNSKVAIYYLGRDVTGDFSGDGFTVNLSDYTPDDNGQYGIPFSVVYGDAGSQVRSDYTLAVTVGGQSDWEITTQPVGGKTYDKGETAETLSVAVTGEDAEKVSYQWQWADNYGLNESDYRDIEDANSATFTPPTTVGGDRTYRCVVTEGTIRQKSEKAVVEVNLGHVNDPEFVRQPGSCANIDYPFDESPFKTVYTEGEAIQPIQAAAGSTETTGISNSPVDAEFAWYYNDENSYDGAVLIDNANYTAGSNSLVGRTVNNVGYYIRGIISNCNITEKLDVGTHYYFCEVYVYEKANPENRSETIRSNILAITVQPRNELEGFTGTGTESDPYLIENVEHLRRIKELVEGGDALAGAVFQLANDITLPGDWDPIGVNNGGSGKNLLPFSGILDGGNHTMTIPDGGKPLLDYARDATVRNLKIYGENIDGSALLNNVCVDYGTDGIYQQLTDPDIITVENVTLLKGSKTSASGLVKGGYSSGINDIIIRNCTIEAGVVIGCDKDESDIGSFVGSFNGRIEDSVSYATVYGVRDVGGLAGSKGQSMGDCIITNSAFLGSIEAIGGHVGGILGAGYVDSTAPQVPPVSVQNCYVAANITANSTPYSVGGQEIGSGIGGIVGSEFGAIAPMNSAYIRDNHFYGTITDTYAEGGYERVGGIIGELGRYDADWMTYGNNYYLENDQYQGLGYLRFDDRDEVPGTAFTAKTATEFADGTVTDLLNQGELKNWVQRAEEDEKDSPYPVHSSVVYVRELTLSGDYKTTYYIGDHLDLSGMVITAHWSDGTTTTLSTGEVEISGYDSTQRNISLVTVRYGVVEAQFTVTVLQRVQEDATITVYFTLLGDENHTDTDVGGDVHGQRMGGLDTWIPRTAYTMDANATAEDLFTMALEKAGIDFTGNRDNPYNSIYIDGIQSPETGDWIEEFTNGPNSGWMYTVDGKHPDVGLSQWFLSDGENFIFHYTDDYAKEEGSEHWGGATPTEENTSPVLEPEAKVDKDGNATVSVSSKDINTAIETADENGAESIIIAPQVEGDVGSLSVTLPKGSMGDILDGTKAGLTVQSDLGHVELPQDTMEAISETTQDGELTITLAAGTVDEAGKLLAGQEDVTEEALKNCSVTEVTLTSGSTEITSLDGTRMRIALPVDGEVFEDGGSYVVYQITDGGQVEKLSGKCITKDGARFVEVTAAAPGTFVAVAAEVLPFTDVTVENWFYGAVQYVYGRGLMNGTSDTIFSPDGTMNRAMLVTILYRLEGEPAVTAANAFRDVPADTWYTDAVIWADAHGIVEGVGSQQFAPVDNITREQMAVMLYRYAQYKGYDLKAGADLSQYTDAADISNWALEAIAWANAEGLITGRTAATIVPCGTATRAEAATILMRFLENAAANK